MWFFAEGLKGFGGFLGFLDFRIDRISLYFFALFIEDFK